VSTSHDLSPCPHVAQYCICVARSRSIFDWGNMHKIIRAQKNTAACMLLVPGGEERERAREIIHTMSHIFILRPYIQYYAFIFVIDV